MVFSSVTFLFCFLPLTLFLWFLAPRILANGWLLVASVVFYVWSSPTGVGLLLWSILFNWLAGIMIALRSGRRGGGWILAGAVAVNLLALAYFKYGGPWATELRGSRWTIPPEMFPLLPVGVSFFTFHAISYLVDIRRKDAVAFRNPLDLGLYLAFFPQLIAGPIVRFRAMEPQIRRREASPSLFTSGAERFILGFARKVLIADPVGAAADHVFALPLSELSPGNAWFGLAAYTLQIYFDFSGYSDMAIGLGRMFGFRLPENFNYPYAARSLREFWRRWHISLSTWFRDYVYIPFGGNRGSRTAVTARLFTVFFLCGLWHGAGARFLAWGLWHGLFLLSLIHI